jgi:DNA-binding response OmpR family regulator
VNRWEDDKEGTAQRTESETFRLPDVLLLSGAISVSRGVKGALSQGGCTVRQQAQEQPLESVSTLPDLDVIVFDGVDAGLLLSQCESVRDVPSRPALLVVSNQSELQARAFQAGADDCISDTCGASLIVERVLMHTRRVRSVRASCSAPRALRTPSGTLAIVHAPQVSLDGAPLDLPRVQLRLLRALMEAESPVSVGTLARSVWPGELVAVHTVHTQVALLRSRLEDLGVKVEHLRGAGYLLSLLQRKEA